MVGVVVGREAEQREIEQFLELLDDGSAVLVLEGDPGIGKTTLLRAGIDAAGVRGIRVLSCAGTAAEARLTFSALADLLRGVEEEAFVDLSPPQRRALDSALLRTASSPSHAEAEAHAVAAAACSVLEWLCERGPVIVAVDDLQWLDASSRRVIEFCARRLPARGGLLASRRPGGDATPASRLAGLGDPERVRVHVVAPLGPDELEGLMRGRSPSPLERRVVRRVAEIAAGNPFYALELLHELPDGSSPGALRLPPSLEEVVASRIEEMPSETVQALLAIAALAAPTVSTLELALGPGVADDLAEAERRGVIEIVDDDVRFTHPLLGEGVYSRAPAATRREMHRKLSAIVTDVEEIARHLAAARIVPEALIALEEGAAHLRNRGAPEGAAELLELALGLGARIELRVQAAAHHFDAGDTRTAVGFLEEVIPMLPAGENRAEALLLLGEIRYKDDSFPHARAVLEQAREEAGENERQLVMIDLRLAFTLYNLGLMPEAGEAGHSALSRAENLGDEALLAQALAVVTIVDFSLGLGFDEARLSRALSLQDPEQRTGAEFYPSLIAGFVFLWSGRFEESRGHLDAVCEQHAERGEEHALAWACFTLVWVETRSGDVLSTTAAAHEAHRRLLGLGTVNGAALALAARAEADAYAGEVDEARQACESSLDLFEKGGWETWSWFPRATLGCLELSIGASEASVAALEPLATLILKGGLPDPAPAGMLFAGDAAEGLIAVGRVDEAESIVAQLEVRGRVLDRAWAIAVGARCRGLLQAAAGDVESADESLQRALLVHERLAMPIERGRSLLALGRIRRRRRRRRAARLVLSEAAEIFDGVGARRWAEQAEAEIACLGVQPGSAERLTPAEERVARLAAKGLTNRDVAATLVVSTKTVEAHLSRAYRKLDIHSRAELGARMTGSRGEDVLRAVEEDDVVLLRDSL